MNKKIIGLAITTFMLAANFTPVFATTAPAAATFATTAPVAKTLPATTTAAASVSAAGITKPAIKLSLNQAVETMKTKGARAMAAELNKKSDQAVANGYSEKASTIKKTLEGLDYLESLGDPYKNVMKLSYEAQVAGATQNNKKILNLRRTFADNNFENNYQADMNKIEQETIKMYYTVLLAEDNYKISKDNLATQQKNLKTVTAKKNVGMLPKKDVLQAQSAVMDAEKDVRAAKTKMEYAHMSFNYLLGFEVMQEVDFTDGMSQTTTSAIDINAAVIKAHTNRNEIRGANFAKEIYQILLKDVDAYPKSSATYLNAQVNFLNAEKTAKDAVVQIEIDIRNRAADLADKEASLEAAKALRNYAQEGVRLITLTNEEGLSTVDELLNAQVNLYKANLNVAKATSEYNMAIKELKDAQGIGTMRIPL